jgi:hypothetical protein
MSNRSRTYAKIDGKRQKDAFNPPVDYRPNYDPKETVLTLRFTCRSRSR